MAKKESIYGHGDKTETPKGPAKKLTLSQAFRQYWEDLADHIMESRGTQGTYTGRMPTAGNAAKALTVTKAKKKQKAGVPQGMKLKKGGKVSKKKTRTTKKPRGVGVAQRGYGKALTGKKK